MKKNYVILFILLFGITTALQAQNNAINLDGTANYVSIPNTYSLNNSAFTVEFDFYMNSLQDYNGGVSSTNNAGIPQPFDFYVNNLGEAKLALGNGSKSETTNLTTLNAGQWYHIAIVVDNGYLSVQINGNLAALSIIDVPLSSTGNIRIGDRMDGVTNANAKFDNVRIWSVARAFSEIQNNRSTCLTGNEAGLDIYYTFENISGNTVPDIAGNNGSQNGTITGSFSNTVGTACTPMIPAAPTTNYATQIFAGDDKTLADLQITGNNIKWYYEPPGNYLLSNDYPLFDKLMYYATQTVTGLESTNRLAIPVNRISNATQIVPPASTVANLVANTQTGATAQWFTTPSGGTPLASSDAITSGTYYVEQVIPATVNTLGSGFNLPTGVAVQADGKILVVDSGNLAVKRMNADGTGIETLGSGGFNSPYDVAIQADGKILVADSAYGVKRMNADGTNIETVASDFFSALAVAVQADGKILVSDYFGGAIKRMNADGSGIETLGPSFDLPNLPTGVGVQADGKILVVNYDAIKRMNADGSNLETVRSGFSASNGVAVQADGKIVVADFMSAVKRMNADGTGFETLGSGFNSPYDVAIQADGKIVVADYNDNAIKRITEASTSNRVAVQVATTTTPATHLNFDGINDYISLTHFEKPNEFTIEAWVKNDYNTGTIICWGKNTNDTSHTKLRVHDGNVNFYTYDNVNDLNSTVSSSIHINSNWHHIAVVKNANPTNNLEIYVDGVLGATSTVNINITSDNLLIGARSYNNSDPFDFFEGELDEVRIWNVARTATQINASKDCELLGSENGLLAYYKFNQGYDQANNAATSTLTNSVTGGSNGFLNNFNLYGIQSNWLNGSPITSGVTCASLGTDDFLSSNDFLVYPNPSSGVFNIQTQENTLLEVYDVSGRKVKSQKATSETSQVDLSGYNNGVYFLKTNQGTTKLIKKGL
ncbi:LamG-like jellyroll fold domain-containing protein [Flavobacterium sp. RS13.1]|uniref:LamG-like jellyroll fold domain-containing protein n=1 Tax=Flavobacterium sp. RS13.1 TaxID=3400345 RepID=UPI003AAD7727